MEKRERHHQQSEGEGRGGEGETRNICENNKTKKLYPHAIIQYSFFFIVMKSTW